MTTSPPARRLWELTQERADEIGASMKDIAREARVSEQTVYQWRRGIKPVSRRSDINISHAFGWEAGSRQLVLNGNNPRLRDYVRPETPPPGTPPSPEPRYPDDPRERAIQAVLETLAPEERLQVLYRFIEEERRTAYRRDAHPTDQTDRDAG